MTNRLPTYELLLYNNTILMSSSNLKRYFDNINIMWKGVKTKPTFQQNPHSHFTKPKPNPHFINIQNPHFINILGKAI